MERKAAFYDDEYVLEDTIQETEDCPAVWLKYRRLNLIENVTFSNNLVNLDKPSILSITEETIKICVKHIVDWDIKDSRGNKVDFSKAENIKKLHPELLGKIGKLIRNDNSDTEKDVKILNEAKNLLREPDFSSKLPDTTIGTAKTVEVTSTTKKDQC